MLDIRIERAALAGAEEHLLRSVAALDDAAVAAASALPGWTRAMLVTHLARNADSNARMIAAALRGEWRPQYPGGPEQRAREIDAGRGRSATDVRNDLRVAAAELAAAFDAVADRWNLVVPAGVGPRDIRDRLHTRWFEVEVHHVDLDVGRQPTDWPDEFVALMLHRTVERMPARRSDGEDGRWTLVADGVGTWAVGDGADRGTARGPAPELLSWLIGRGGDVTITGDAADIPYRFPHP